MCSDSLTGTRGSFRPCWMKSGARGGGGGGAPAAPMPPAVGAAVDDRPRAVDLVTRREPVVQRGEVAHGVETELDVVEVRVALAVPGRTAHVRCCDRIA